MSEEVSVIKCINCGADMLYDPDKGKLACPYCDSTKDVVKSLAAERNYFTEKRDGEVIEGTQTFACPNCGGEVVMENYVTATACPFCGATNIVKKENIPGLKPDSILPFALSQKKAADAGKAWIKKRIFAPSKAKKNFSPDRFNGVYSPAFSFTSFTNSTYSGRLGEYYYVTVGSGKNRHTERRTRWFDVSGRLDKVIPDMVIEASRQLNQEEMNKILPFDTGTAEAYKREYLAGFTAERYDTGLDDSFETAKGQMSDLIKQDILSRYKYDVIDHLNVNTQYSQVDFHYIMLPLWVCGYKFKDKLYRFIVNGRTGKSTGKYPVSPLRVAFTVFLGLAIVAAIVLLVLHDNGMI